MQTIIRRALLSRAVTAQVRMAGGRMSRAALGGVVMKGKVEDRKVAAAEKACNAAQQAADRLATKKDSGAVLRAAAQVALREKRAALVAARKVAAPARAAAAKARHCLLRRSKAAGPTSPYAAFLSEEMKGQKPDGTGNA
eukprot:Hpha_TRINITY_DN16790_c3_g6::TRINITY_DN16790_c3_g6_i1::g.80137::m.80137